ncbi:MAG: DUF167 domain-containing protein [Deltaproteobacteria bacterium]|jgi:uncharacterized protein (TIGR00251 family)
MWWVQESPEGITFRVTVQPRGSKNEIVGLQGDALKIKLTAPPVEGAANRMCVEFLAKSLKVRKSDVKIIQGHSSRAKKVLVRSANRDSIQSLLRV